MVKQAVSHTSLGKFADLGKTDSPSSPHWQDAYYRRNGAGQHGVATATVCAKFGLECIIYMGAEDVRRQALNVFRIEMLGGKVRLFQTDSHHFIAIKPHNSKGHPCPLWVMHPQRRRKRGHAGLGV